MSDPSFPPDAIAQTNGELKFVFYSGPDDTDVVEVCDMQSGALVLRKYKPKVDITGKGWTFTYGAPEMEKQKNPTELISLSQSNPIFVIQHQGRFYRWLIQNIPYPSTVYDITVDTDRNQIVIRTTNRKYFRRIDAPEGVVFDSGCVQWKWAEQILQIRYPRPEADIARENRMCSWRASLKIVGNDPCNTQ